MNSVAMEGDTITSPSQTVSSNGSTLVGNSLSITTTGNYEFK